MTTDPTTLSLADLAAAVVRLGAHRGDDTLVAGNCSGSGWIWEDIDEDACTLLLAAANRLPGVVADLDAALELITGLNRRLDEQPPTVDQLYRAESGALLARAAEGVAIRERDAALARVAELEAHLAKQAPVVTVSLLTGVNRFDEWRDAVRVDVNGVIVGAEEFGSEPEDNSGSRAYRWVPEMLEALAAKIGATVERKDEHNLNAGAFDDKLYPPRKETP